MIDTGVDCEGVEQVQLDDYVMRTSLLCIQCKDQSLEHVRDSWISRYVLTLSFDFQNLHLVPCMFY
jgi:hypothetical protein